MSASGVLLGPSHPGTTRSEPPAPPPLDPDGDGGGGGSGWVRLLRAPNDIEAHLLVGRLAESGVEGRIMWEKGAPSAWLYGASKPWAPVMVMVRQRQLEDARMVLAEVSFAAPDHVRQAPVERDWRMPVVWWATALVLGAILSGTALAQVAQVTFSRCQLPIFCND